MAADSGCAFQGHVEALVVRGTGPAVLVEPEAFRSAVGELELPGARLYQSSAGTDTQLAGPDLAFRDWKSLEPVNMHPPERFEVRYAVRPAGAELSVQIQLTPGGGEPGYFQGPQPGDGSCVDRDCEIRAQIWQDRQLIPGTDWKQDIDAALDQAELVLLLVSADFIDSTNCMGEFERAVELERAGTTRIIPVILRPCAWKGLELGRREVLPTDGKPVDSSAWSSRDEAWIDVVEGVRRAALAAWRPAQEQPGMGTPVAGSR